MRSRFATIVTKRVQTFVFDRSFEERPQDVKALFQRMDSTRRQRGIVVTSPESVLSFQLKYIELLHNLDLSKNLAASASATSKLAKFSETADEIARVLRMWKQGILLMDEVDMLLHPLRFSVSPLYFYTWAHFFCCLSYALLSRNTKQ